MHLVNSYFVQKDSGCTKKENMAEISDWYDALYTSRKQ